MDAQDSAVKRPLYLFLIRPGAASFTLSENFTIVTEPAASENPFYYKESHPFLIFYAGVTGLPYVPGLAPRGTVVSSFDGGWQPWVLIATDSVHPPDVLVFTPPAVDAPASGPAGLTATELADVCTIVGAGTFSDGSTAAYFTSGVPRHFMLDGAAAPSFRFVAPTLTLGQIIALPGVTLVPG